MTASSPPCCQIANGSRSRRSSVDLVRIDLADRRDARPMAASRCAPRAAVGVEADQRRPAVEVELVENVDLGGLAVAGDPHLVDGEARAARSRLRDGGHMAAEIGAVERWSPPRQSAVAIVAAEARRRELAVVEPRQQPGRPPQPARQDEAVDGEDTPNAAPPARPASRPAPTSTQTRSVLHHPTQQIAERVSRLGGDFGHQRRRRHARLRVDLEPDELAILRVAVVVAEVRSGDAPAADCLMSLQRQCLYFLVNIW